MENPREAEKKKYKAKEEKTKKIKNKKIDKDKEESKDQESRPEKKEKPRKKKDTEKDSKEKKKEETVPAKVKKEKQKKTVKIKEPEKEAKDIQNKRDSKRDSKSINRKTSKNTDADTSEEDEKSDEGIRRHTDVHEEISKEDSDTNEHEETSKDTDEETSKEDGNRNEEMKKLKKNTRNAKKIVESNEDTDGETDELTAKNTSKGKDAKEQTEKKRRDTEEKNLADVNSKLSGMRKIDEKTIDILNRDKGIAEIKLKEGAHIVKEKVNQTASTEIKDNELIKRDQKTVKITIKNDTSSGTIEPIEGDMLKEKDKIFGTTLLKKANSKLLVDFKEINDSKKKESRESLETVAAADKLLEKLSLYYSRNKRFAKRTDSLAKITRKLSTETVQRIFLHVLHRIDNPYVILYVLSKFTSLPPFLSDDCAVQFSLFLRSLRGMYLETVPYSKIVKDLVATCIMPDVSLEHIYSIVAEIEQTRSVRDLLVDLYGKVHIISYYREVCNGAIIKSMGRNVIYSMIYTINDKRVSVSSLEQVFAKLDKYAVENTVEKNVSTFARCI